jgi:putative FmdB family regulatory protein
MPTYEYRCTACKHEFEEFQSMSAKVLKKCPACSKNALERLIGTGAALVFKGSGFYQTDYRSESYKKAATADKPADPSMPDTKPETKSDTKPEAKSAPKPESKSESKPDPKPAKPDTKPKKPSKP